MAFLGFLEVVRHLPFIKKVQKDLLTLVKEKEIKTAVLIDYPGFNLNIAKKLKAMGVKIIYYISPQVWAWGSGRVKKIQKLVDKMLVVFPFEEEFYKSSGVAAEFVGHPLLERISEHNFLPREELFEKFGLDKSKEILLLLAGSRKHEVEKIFPVAVEAAVKAAEEFNREVVAACSPNIDESFLSSITGAKDFKVVKGYTYDLMKYSKFGIIKSGTSTLEAGLFELPMVIVYKTSYLTYVIGKNLVKVNSIGMANIVAGEKVAPELIQNEVSPESIYRECKEILSNAKAYETIKEKLKKIKDKLGSSGASARAAGIIYSALNET
jgi:lipid-A-disaccharide synthase